MHFFHSRACKKIKTQFKDLAPIVFAQTPFEHVAKVRIQKDQKLYEEMPFEWRSVWKSTILRKLQKTLKKMSFFMSKINILGFIRSKLCSTVYNGVSVDVKQRWGLFSKKGLCAAELFLPYHAYFLSDLAQFCFWWLGHFDTHKSYIARKILGRFLGGIFRHLGGARTSVFFSENLETVFTSITLEYLKSNFLKFVVMVPHPPPS